MKIYTNKRKRTMQVAKMMDSDYESGLSSDEIDKLIMEEEATRQNAERLLLMDMKDEEEVLHFVANLDKADPVTGSIDFDIGDTSTHMVEVANKIDAKYGENSNEMGYTVEIHELCNFKCGRKEGHPRWMCKCVTMTKDTEPITTRDLFLLKVKQWRKEFKTRNMLKKKALEVFNEHCEDVYADMEMERAVKEISEEEARELLEDENINYDGDNDDEIDYGNIDGMELESSSDKEEEEEDIKVQRNDDGEGEEESDWETGEEESDWETGDATVNVGEMIQSDDDYSDVSDGNESSSSHDSVIPIKKIKDNEEEDENDDTDDEEKFILYHLVTNGDSGYEKVELNHDTLQQGWNKIVEKFERIPNRHDFPNIVDLPTWPSCCVESQSHKKCNCGEFVKEKVAKLTKELVNLYGTRGSENMKKRLEYNEHDADSTIKNRLEMLNRLKEKEKVVKKKPVVKKKTFRRRVKKRKHIDYKICPNVVLQDEDFENDVESQRAKRIACPICQEPASRKLNAMQHAVAKHHCTVWKRNKRTNTVEKLVLNYFRCPHENCRMRHGGAGIGWHQPDRFLQHMRGVHHREFVPFDGGYIVEGYEECIVRPLRHGCGRRDCTSYTPCGACSENYGCSNIACGCWLPR